MNTVNQNSLLINALPGETDLTAILNNLCRKAGQEGVVTIAQGIAKRILDELNFEGQRSVKRARVNERLTSIQDGSWEPQISVITLAELPDGTMILIDGQHRLSAIVEHDSPVKTALRVVKAADMDEVRRLYTKFDMKTSGRTESELLSASGLVDLLGVKFKTAEILLKAIAVIDNRMEPEIRGAGRERLAQFDYRQSLAPSWGREARELDAIIDKADTHIRRKLLRAGTMAVALYTLRHQRERAIQFWGGLADNDGLRKTDPRSRLIADFISRSVDSGARRQSVQQSAMAWNAFYENRELKIIKCIEGAEIVIAGTPMRKGGAK